MTNGIKNEMVIAMMDYGVIYTWQENGKVFWQTMGVGIKDGMPRMETDGIILCSVMTDGVDWNDPWDVLSAIHEKDETVGDPYKETWFEL